MPTLEEQIQNRTEEFAAELSTLIRQVTLEAVGDALQRAALPKTVQKPGRPMRVLRAVTKPSGSNGPERKRSSKALTGLSKALIAEITREPGRGIQAIAAALGVSTKDLTLPMKALLADGRLTRSGQKRGTKYYPA